MRRLVSALALIISIGSIASAQGLGDWTDKYYPPEPEAWESYPPAEWSGHFYYRQMVERNKKAPSTDWVLSRRDKAPIGSKSTGKRNIEVVQVVDDSTIIINDTDDYLLEYVAVSGIETEAVTTGSKYELSGMFQRQRPYRWGAESLPHYLLLDASADPKTMVIPFIREWELTNGRKHRGWIINTDGDQVMILSPKRQTIAFERDDLIPKHKSLVQKFVRARYLFSKEKKVPIDYMGKVPVLK